VTGPTVRIDPQRPLILIDGEGQALMIVLMVAALVGGLVTFAMLWPYGVLIALMGAPFGGSLLTLLAGLLLAFLSTRAEQKQDSIQAPQHNSKAAA
jgi:hypothetical protein